MIKFAHMKLEGKQSVALAAILTAAIIVLIVMLVRSNSQMEEMTQVFTEERQQLVSDYQDLSLAYEEVHTDNDSLDNLVNEQRARVEQLTEELKTIKASNARRIKELQGELSTLRTVMRSFIVQIDSLNATNNALRKENDDIKGRLASVRRESASLREANQELTQKVTVAARLEAHGVVATTLNDRDKATSRLSKIAKIKVGFSIAKNVSAQVGMKDIYLRLTRPDGQLLYHSKGDTFRFEDADINFSAKRQVEYGGEETPTYIIYAVDMGELMPGRYDIELFADGERIGGGNVELR